MIQSRLNLYLPIFFALICGHAGYGQIDTVLIETYYITDGRDSTDKFGGGIDAGVTTYRIFVDLAPGSRILRVFGSEDHPLRISSSEPFFNHLTEGVLHAYDLNRNRYEEGVVALDSYITLGQCSRRFSGQRYFGVPKEADNDGSVIGGENNDGGSEYLPGGLLINEQEELGIPLTEADGLVVVEDKISELQAVGFEFPGITPITIFGEGSKSMDLDSTQVQIRSIEGVIGPDSLSNIILITQLTTAGEISFDLNIEVEIPLEGGGTENVLYVGTNEAIEEGVVFEPLLSFPYECGCTDPDFLEADVGFACSDNSLCLTPIVLGCTDTAACNFDASANLNLPGTCCYVGQCQDRDLSVVCPQLELRNTINEQSVKLYPNPANSEILLEFDFVRFINVEYVIRNSQGRILRSGEMDGQQKRIEVSSLLPGYYLLEFWVDQNQIIKPFVKI